MKIRFTKTLCALGAMAVFSMSPMAHADDTSGTNPPATNPPTTVTPIATVSCGLDAYNQRISEIRQFSPKQELAIGIPAVPAAFMLYLLGQGGGAEGMVVAVPAGLLGVAGAEYGVMRTIKHYHMKPYKEVAANLAEAQKGAATDKDIRHTATLIESMDHKDHTTDEVAQAVLDAAQSGDLCDAKGKLKIKGDFRKAVLKHLDANSATPKLADAEKDSSAVTSVKPSESGTTTAPAASGDSKPAAAAPSAGTGA